MTLTEDEYKHVRGAMDLKTALKPKPYPQQAPMTIKVKGRSVTSRIEAPSGYGLYQLRSDCGNLAADYRCSIYETRPKCCRTFELGSPACLKLRRDAGLDLDKPVPAFDEPILAVNDRAKVFLAEHSAIFKSGADVAPAPAHLRREAPTIPGLTSAITGDGRWIASLLTSVTTEAWSNPTRCAGWNIGDLANHIVTGLWLVHDVVTAAVEQQSLKDQRTFRGARDAALAALEVALSDIGRDLALLSPSLLSRPVHAADSTLSVSYVVTVLAAELAIHATDLSAATGAKRRLNENAIDAIASALPDWFDDDGTPPLGAAYVLQSDAFELPISWRDGSWHLEAAPDPCRIEGAAEAVLLFALGREDFNPTRLITNDAQRARKFKQFLTGP